MGLEWLCVAVVAFSFADPKLVGGQWNPLDLKPAIDVTQRPNTILTSGVRATARPKPPPERRVEHGCQRRSLYVQRRRV
ncbi:hypothetical protein [Haladaptatus sp. NG-WS-4]